MVSVLRFDELDREAIRQNSDNATDAGSDGQRRSDLRLHISRDRDAGHRHVDNKAAVGRAIGKGQSGVRISRDNPRILPKVCDAVIALLLFKPSELIRHLLSHGPDHVEFEQETAANSVADKAFELTEIREVGCDVIPEPADHGYVDHHSERRNAAGSARKSARLTLRVIPIRECVVPADGNVDGSLFEEFFDGHSTSSRKVAGGFIKWLA